MQYVKIYACPNKGMIGSDLQRFRDAAGLSQGILAEKLRERGWEIDQQQISRWETFGEEKFYTHGDIMADLLKILNLSSLPVK